MISLPPQSTEDEFPDCVYKYLPITNRTIQMLAKGSLYFSSRSKLNDPIDSRPIYRCDISESDQHQLIRMLKLSGLSSPSRSSVASDQIIGCVEDMLDNVGILSMSRRWDSVVMWGHYAGAHTGACLGFRRDLGDEDRRRIAFGTMEYGYPRVLYFSELYRIFVRREAQIRNRLWNSAFLAKAEDWSYEQECRFKYPGVTGEQAWPGHLGEVIFGVNTHEESLRTVVNLLTERIGRRFLVFCTEFSADGFKLTKIPR